jgi:SAM-dependent methyltransferase
MKLSGYACPVTGLPLEEAGSTLRSAQGEASYPVLDGIPCFLRSAAVEDAEARERLGRLNELGAQGGWRAAIDAVYAADPDFVRYVTDDSRTRVLDLVSLDSASRVLEIGPGLGQITAALARRAGSVCALEVVPQQARFVALRCAQSGLRNVSVAAGGDDCRLPYAASSFDAVVLNLVLEWCAARSTAQDAEAMQRRLLSEMARVLRPGGVIWLCTKNRFALRYVLGKPDEHSRGLRFGSALPRALRDRLVRSRRGELPVGLLHSHRQLRRMLREAGFERIAAYWLTPEMRFPREYVPLDARSVRAARARRGFPQGDSRLTALAMRLVPAALVKHLTPGHAFLAQKAG